VCGEIILKSVEVMKLGGLLTFLDHSVYLIAFIMQTVVCKKSSCRGRPDGDGCIIRRRSGVREDMMESDAVVAETSVFVVTATMRHQ